MLSNALRAPGSLLEKAPSFIEMGRTSVDRSRRGAAVLVASSVIAACHPGAETTAIHPDVPEVATLGAISMIRPAGSELLANLHFATFNSDGSALRRIGTLLDTRLDNGGARAATWSRVHDRFAQVARDGIQVTTNLSNAGARGGFAIPIRAGSVPIYFTQLVVYDLAWSPDGRRLAAAIGRRGDYTFSTVLTFPADSGVSIDVYEGEKSDVTTVYLGPNDFPGALDLAWSSRGDSLLLAISGRSEGPSGIYAVAANGSGLRPVVQVQGDRRLGQPAWSPDARMVAFVETRHEQGLGERSSIVVASANGGSPRYVTGPASSTSDMRPMWRNDGGELAFIRIRHDGDSGQDQATAGVFLVPSEGGAPRAVPVTSGAAPGERFDGLFKLSW